MGPICSVVLQCGIAVQSDDKRLEWRGLMVERNSWSLTVSARQPLWTPSILPFLDDWELFMS